MKTTKPEIKETLETYKANQAKKDKRNAVLTTFGLTFFATLILGATLGYFLSISIITESQGKAVEVVKDLATLKANQ